MTRMSKIIWAGMTLSLSVAVVLVAVSVAEAYSRTRQVANTTIVVKSQHWPIAPMITMEPCKQRACVSL